VGQPRPPADPSAGDLGEPDGQTSLQQEPSASTQPPLVESSDSASRADEPRSAEPSDSPRQVRETADKRRGGVLGFFKELPGLIIIAFALALVIKTFLIQAFFIPSQSMVPTLKVGDRVLVNKLVYDFGEPQHGDIIVFENPSLVEPDRNVFEAVWHWLIEGLGFSTDPTKDFIKRVVGLPGDTVEMKNGKVFVNGTLVPEPYIHNAGAQDYPSTVVEPDRVFVMGDNRPNSQDSRSALGQIPMDKIVGKAFVLLWPPSRVEWLSDD
jgi:signal peptidase I